MTKVIETYAKNQVVIQSGDNVTFQSYDSVIATKDTNGIVHLSEHYDYSRTTMKYLKMFLGHGIAETRKLIESGKYKRDMNLVGEY